MSRRKPGDWWDHSWNPVTGCRRVSEGCKHCWAHSMVKRFPELHGYEEGFSWHEERPASIPFHRARFHEDRLAKIPGKPGDVIFVCSLGDLFYGRVDEEWIYAVIETIRATPDRRFVLLTKRAHGMAVYFQHYDVPENVILGVSVENQGRALERIPPLVDTRAAYRMVSFEPLLGEIDPAVKLHYGGRSNWAHPERMLVGINWVIVGGETGPGARPMPVNAARTLRDAAIEAGAAFWFKSWGRHVPQGQGKYTLDGKTWHRTPFELGGWDE